MSDSHTTATPETTNAAPTAHPPVRENQRAVEAEVEQGNIAGQQIMRAVGGGSPETPPEQFSGALGQLSGLSQTGMLRQLQRSYGNSYVGAVIQRKADGNGTCTDCEKKEIQRKADGDVSAIPDGFEATMQRSGSGHPLDEGTRSFMESRFSQDFGNVQIHINSAAAEASQQIQAQAFTTGRDIYFGRGRFQPEATEGKKLLAHELTHVVQQNSEVVATKMAKPLLGQPEDNFELEANQIANWVVDRQLVPPNATSPQISRMRGVIARQSDAGTPPQATPTTNNSPTSLPITETIPFDGEELSVSEGQVEKLFIKYGEESATKLVERFIENAKTEKFNLQDESGVREESAGYKLKQKIALELEKQLTAVREKIVVLKGNFKSDVENVAFARLKANEDYVKAEMQRFGLSETTEVPSQDFVPSFYSGQVQELQEIRKLANLVVYFQANKEEMKKAVVAWDRTTFNPEQPTSQLNSIWLGERTFWDLVKEQWDQCTISIAQIANTNPTLFVAMSQGLESLSLIAQTDPAKGRLAALQTIHTLLKVVLSNIKTARFRLQSGDSDYHDLKPIHSQLFAGLPASTQWDQPFNQWVAREEIKSHAEVEAWIKLGLTSAAMIIAIAATLATSGGAAFLIGAAVSIGAAGLEYKMAEDKYTSLAVANQSQVKEDTALVDKQQVQSAQIEAQAARIKLFVTAAISLGGHYLAPGVSGAVGKGLSNVSQGLLAGSPGALRVLAGGALVSPASRSIFTGITIGATFGAFEAALTNLPALSSGQMTEDDYLSKLGWSAFMGGLIGGAFSAIHTALSKPKSTALVKPTPEPSGSSSTALAKPSSTAFTKPTPDTGELTQPTTTAIATTTPEPAGGTGGSSVWKPFPPRVNTMTGEVIQMVSHAPTGEIYTIRFNPNTGNGSITRLITGETAIISGGQLYRQPGLLPSEVSPNISVSTPADADFTLVGPRLRGRLGEVTRFEEVGRYPGKTTTLFTQTQRQRLYSRLEDGSLTLKDFAKMLGRDGVEQFYFRTPLGGRYIDHVYPEGKYVMLRESKNVSDFSVTKDVEEQLAKDMFLLQKHPEAVVHWRISGNGKINENAYNLLTAISERTGGRFRFQLQDGIIPPVGTTTSPPTIH